MEKRYKLRGFRSSKGINQLEMARIGKVGLSTYNAIENGKQDGKLKFWNNLQDKFNLTGEQLCELQTKQTTQEF